MPDQSYVLQIGDTYEWVNDWLQAIEDGHYRKGISRLYTALTAGDYAGSTAITVNGKTDTKTNNCVQDERTGLVFTKSPAASVGPASDGKLYWDDHLARIEYSGNLGNDFAPGIVVTQAVSGATGLIRYVSESTGKMAVESVENGPFDTTNTISAAGGIGPADVDSFEAGSGEDIFSYVIAANLAELAGFSDWRVVNIFELLGLMLLNVTNGNAKPDLNYFTYPGTDDLVWSATHDASERGLHVLAPRFDTGGVTAGTSSQKGFDTGYLYLVRGPDLTEARYCLPLKTDFTQIHLNFFDDGFYQLGVEKSFTILDQGQHAGNKSFDLKNGDSHTIENKCVLDNNTELMWLHALSDHAYPYYDADGRRGDALEFLRFVNAYAVGGYTDWRIPNALEGLSVYDAQTERTRSEVTNNTGVTCWSCTPRPDLPASVLYFPAGRPWSYSGADRSTGGPYWVRVVRGGVTDADLPT